MLSPEYLATFPDYIVELFEQYDAFVIADFSRRVAKAAAVTETAEWQAIRAHEMGLAMDELTERSAELLGITQDELKTMFQEAYDTYVESDRKRLSGSGLDYDRIARSKTIKSYMKAAQKQTQRSLKNIVGTAGAIKSMTGTRAIRLKTGTGYQPVKKAYTMALDLAQMQVSTGVLDYETAVRHAIRTTARSGVSTLINDAVGYASGYHLSLRSAARMCVLTGVNQMAGQMNDLVCDELGLDLVEVTAHLGARPTHQVWQGQIYSRSGKSKKYPDLVSSTGLGDVAGLMGANCRHSYYGYYEGSPRAYTDAELYAMTDEGGPKIEYGGKTYTYYEATQRQRQLEREIIATKRELIGYQAAGDKEAFQSASIKLRTQKTRYQEFSKAAGIRSKWERSQQDGYDRSIAGKSAWAVRKSTKSTVAKSVDSGIMKARNISDRRMANGLRTSPYHVLTDEEIKSIKTDADSIGIPEEVLVFNEGFQTGFSDKHNLIYVRGDVLPDLNSSNLRDRLSQKAVLAHEYYGHFKNHPSSFKVGDWRDEFRASYRAALDTPNLSDDERRMLMLDAFDRAKEAGVSVKYNKQARRLIYGYDD